MRGRIVWSAALGLSLLTACARKTADGPAFAPLPKQSGQRVVYVYRPDAFEGSGLSVTVGLVPVPEKVADPMAAALRESWQKGKDSVTLGQLFVAAAKGAAQGVADAAGVGALVKEAPKDEGPIEHCWSLENGGFAAEPVADGQALVVVYSSGSDVSFRALHLPPGADGYVKVELESSGFSFETKLTEVTSTEAGNELRELHQTRQCQGS
jgi:hypothetical protein